MGLRPPSGVHRHPSRCRRVPARFPPSPPRRPPRAPAPGLSASSCSRRSCSRRTSADRRRSPTASRISGRRCAAWRRLNTASGFSWPSTAPVAMAGWASDQLICVGLAPSAVKVARNSGEPTTRIFKTLEVFGRADRPLRVGDLAEAVLAPGQRHHVALAEKIEHLLPDSALHQRVERPVVRHQEGQREQVQLPDLRRPIDGRADRHVDHALAQRSELLRLVPRHQGGTRIDLDVDAALRLVRGRGRPSAWRPSPRDRPRPGRWRACTRPCRGRPRRAVRSRLLRTRRAQRRLWRDGVFSMRDLRNARGTNQADCLPSSGSRLEVRAAERGLQHVDEPRASWSA